MKRIRVISFVIVLVIVFSLLFVGCGGYPPKVTERKYNSCYDFYGNLVEIGNGEFRSGSYFIYADKETGVMYFLARSGYQGYMCAILNSDGTPMLYDFGE
jgi:hypothetical protein